MREESRYVLDDDYGNTRPTLTPAQIKQLTTEQNSALTEQVDYPQITADQNNFNLLEGVVHRLTSDASRTITGFANVGPGLKVILNGGAQDLVLANNNVGSDAANRILSHTTANITLNPNESALIFYDRTSTRVRTLGFV